MKVIEARRCSHLTKILQSRLIAPFSRPRVSRLPAIMKAKKRYCFLIILLLFPGATNARDPDHPGLIGLLEIPYAWDDQTNENHLLAPVRLFSSPITDGTELRILHNLGDVETHEWSYELPAAAVYGYHYDGEQTWYQLRESPSGDLAWMSGDRQNRFHPLSKLVSESLAYLTATWDKRIFATVGDATTSTVVVSRGEEISIAVASSAMFEGKLWILVVVLKDSVCSSSDAPRVLGSGWIPAHSASGTLNIWFYSRGC